MDRSKSDCHIHSKYSPDSNLEPKEILSRAEALNLTSIAITDHDTVQGGVEAEKINTTSIKVIPGVEVKTDKGDLIGLGIREEIKSKKLNEVCKEIKEKGGEVYAPHPFDQLRKSALREDTYKIVNYLDYVEGYNGRCLLNSFNKKAVSFAKENNIPLLFGSDAHFLFEVGNIKRTNRNEFTSSVGLFLTKGYKLLKQF